MIHAKLTSFIPAAMLAAALFLPQPVPAHDAGAQLGKIAKAWLDSLSPELRAKGSFRFEDEEERTNWHFIPRERKGAPMKEMSPQSRLLAFALLNTGLGAGASAKAVTIMSLEEILFQIEGADPAKRDATRIKRDPEQYFVSVFGEPGDKGAWAWRIEGHHLSINFTIKDGKLVRSTPTFFGSNPAEVREGPLTGLRVLGTEEDLGRQLVKSLNESQAGQAILAGEVPKEIITAAERKVNPLSPAGLPDSEMNEEQKKLLDKIITEYIGRVRPDLAEEALAEIRKSDAPIYFAWAGPKEPGEGHYYRVQGKTFLLEYDNTQNGANHAHTVWRNFDGDFGRDILGEHYQAEHGK